MYGSIQDGGFDANDMAANIVDNVYIKINYSWE